jgi:chromosome partitioning protein
MILAVGNTKGGVGKTTIAVNLAAARAMAGRNVWLIDGDIQGTAQTAIGLRSEAGREPGIACALYSDGILLRNQLRQQKKNFDDVVIDVGARDSTSLRAAMLMSDVFLIPFQPRSFDVWAIADVVSVINEVNDARDGLTCYAMLNMADPTNTVDNKEAAETVADFPPLIYLPTMLRRRKSFANAAALGLCVYELANKDKDPKAEDELRALCDSVFEEV